MGKVNEGLWTERRELLRRVDESGISAAEFCRREGIPYWKLMEWRKRIREIDGLVDETEWKPAFAELVVEKSVAKKADRSSSAQVEIALPGGAVVRIFEGVDGSMVRSIVEAAKSC